MQAKDITAVVVTKGGYPIDDVLESLTSTGFAETIVWDNSKETNCSVYGRWKAVRRAKTELVAVQDDDVIVDWDSFISQTDPWLWKMPCNMPAPWRPVYKDTGISLVGFGAILPSNMAGTGFRRYLMSDLPVDDIFLRECDRVWTHAMQKSITWVDAPIQRLERGNGPDRMWKEARHEADYQEIRRRLATL